jgi:hypothetical protein
MLFQLVISYPIYGEQALTNSQVCALYVLSSSSDTRQSLREITAAQVHLYKVSTTSAFTMQNIPIFSIVVGH